jgi:hypothetical protein
VKARDDPNLDTKNGIPPTALFKTINMEMPVPDEVPGDLKLAGDIKILGTPSVELSNAHVDVIEDAQTLPQVPQNWHEQIRNEHDNSGV